MLANELNLWKYVEIVQHNMENHKSAFSHFRPKEVIECTSTLAMTWKKTTRLKSTACCDHFKASLIHIAETGNG
jgi:hypothetical protein